MEACVGAHHLSRKLQQALGHDARLMPAKYVRPYSKGQKNDFRDAEAITEAVQATTPRHDNMVERAGTFSYLSTGAALSKSKLIVGTWRNRASPARRREALLTLIVAGFSSCLSRGTRLG
jgi:hypothetical protein